MDRTEGFAGEAGHAQRRGYDLRARSPRGEAALQEAGISPQVVHRPEQFDSMQPLAHSQVTVIKLHGDYADLEQRNTVDELETYPEAQQKVLERVLDEYGLIVCGWSADWDTALVRAVEGTRSRRYPMFWSQYGSLGSAAGRLTARHSAAVIEGKDADELFTDLVRRVEASPRRSPWTPAPSASPISGCPNSAPGSRSKARAYRVPRRRKNWPAPAPAGAKVPAPAGGPEASSSSSANRPWPPTGTSPATAPAAATRTGPPPSERPRTS
jgi:hypothetical protein